MTENEKIAKFMGEIMYRDREEMNLIPISQLKPYYFLSQLKYDTSWRWLMPVVEKINKFDSEIHYDKNVRQIIDDIRRTVANVDILLAYKYIIIYIDWYESQKVN